jgi:hypothetical protein
VGSIQPRLTISSRSTGRIAAIDGRAARFAAGG